MALRFAIIGTGYWANYQIAAWMELEGIELVALYNRTKVKAEVLGLKFNIPRIYDQIDALFENEKLDFVDIITDVDTHPQFITLAMNKGIAVICQKPMASNLDIAKKLVTNGTINQVPFFIHENFRWQRPIRKVKEILETGKIGKVFKARVSFCSSFPVFDNQPFLAELDKFILTDVGSHVLDVCRFLFGEVDSLLCHVGTVNPNIKGEDVASVMMKMRNNISCYAEMSYASILEEESFPQTFILIEGQYGSINLTKDYQIKLTTKEGTTITSAPPQMYSWIDPEYALVHSSIVECNKDLLKALQGKAKAETTGEDNLETVKLVHAAYASAQTNQLIDLKSFI